MRVVAWNTARRDRATQIGYLAPLQPDVAVLPEFGRHPVATPECRGAPDSLVSFGEDGKLGVCAAAWRPWSLLPADDPPLEGVVIGALDVTGPLTFRLIAAWPYLSKKLPIDPIVEAVASWSDWLGGHDVVVAGDFNTGCGWEKSQPWLDHRLVVQALEELGLRSAYHSYWDVPPGVGELPTHWHNLHGPFHIDHVFAPKTWPIREVQVGPPNPWKTRSDHAPVLVDYARPG